MFRYAAIVVAAVIAAGAGAVQKPRPIVPVIAEPARPLPLSAVRLTGGPLKHAQDLDVVRERVPLFG